MQTSKYSKKNLSKGEGNSVIHLLRDNEKAPDFPGLFEELAVPPTGAELSQESAENSTLDTQDDALSDARRVFNQIDDSRLVKLIEVWSALPDDVKGEILTLAHLIEG